MLARVIVACVHIVGTLPLRVLHALGGTLARIAWWFPIRERAVTRTNLALAYPDMDAAARERLGRASLVETGKGFAEICAFWTADRARLERMIIESDGVDRMKQVLASGRGVIIAAPHLGAWELGGIFLNWTFGVHALYREPRIRELDDFFRQARSRFGGEFYAAGPGAARFLLRALKDARMIAILPDQDAGEGAGVFVPFFGVPANTMTLLSRLTAKTGARVFLAWAERVPGGFHQHFVEASDDVHSADVAVSAAALSRDIETQVRRRPEQYLWSYKRYRIRPTRSENFYRRG